MADLIKFFETFANHYPPGKLALLSAEGKLLSPVDLAADWEPLFESLPVEKPLFKTGTNHTAALVPLRQKHDTLGYLAALEIRREDMPLLRWGAQIIISQLENEEALQDMTDELIGAWNQLGLIYRVNQNLSFTADLTAVLQSILEEIKKVIGTEDGFILLQRAHSLQCVTCTEKIDPKLYNHTLLHSLLETEHVALCDTNRACRKLWPQAPASVTRMLATNLAVEDGVRAALGVINKADAEFTAGDSKLLAALAQQVSAIIKNFLTHQNLIIKERVSRELEIAAEIQQSLLPTSLPQVGNLSMAVASMPASEVGGDFYDFITVSDHNLTVVIGDVAGKGIPAAMLTSLTRTMLRVEALHAEAPHQIIRQANNLLHQDLSRTDSFVTAFVAAIDPVTGRLHYASAGHVPAILWRYRSGTTELLKATSVPIGISGYQGEESRSLRLGPGDILLLYTDGITEAQAPGGDLFGIERLTQTLKTKAPQPVETIQEHIQATITNFSDEAANRDDASLLVIKMVPQPEEQKIIHQSHFSYPAELHSLMHISQETVAACRRLSRCSDLNQFFYLLELTISEICTNIIKHAYAGQPGEINVSIIVSEEGIQLDFYDQGKSFDPSTVPRPSFNPPPLNEGGFGLHIVRQIMDVVSYERHPEKGNHWRLIKLLPPPPEIAS